jgi:hypothetical protein
MLTKTLSPAILGSGYSSYQAAKKQKEYEAAATLTEDPRQSAVYDELARVHRQLRMGRKVISVTKALREAGTLPSGLPVLAIANATAKWAYFFSDGGRFHDADGRWNHAAVAFVSVYDQNPLAPTLHFAAKSNIFKFSAEHFLVRTTGVHRARVPLVPPNCVPKNRPNLENYQILWEANWQTSPKDPLLLRRISREWYVIEAEWDLTDVERLVLEVAAFQGE